MWTDRLCVNPWTYVELFAGGNVYFCCPTFTGDKPIGNIFRSSPEKIWNSPQALIFRAQMLNGSFAQCDCNKCPGLLGNLLPTRESILQGAHGVEIQQALRDRAIILDRGPTVVKLCYDVSCNLWCPSCRSERIVARKTTQEALNRVRDEFILPFLKDARILVLSGDGDPFASRHYRDIMRMTWERLPDLRLSLHTNAVLLDERAWRDLHLEGRVGLIQVSIDAATAETYAIVRRGGDFNRLLSNLEFLAGKRRRSEFARLELLYVVQTCNFLEMGDFVRLGQRLGVDSIHFSLIEHWGRGMNAAQYREAQIWRADHPRRREFLAALADPILDDPIVEMSARQKLLGSAA